MPCDLPSLLIKVTLYSKSKSDLLHIDHPRVVSLLFYKSNVVVIISHIYYQWVC